MGIYGGAFDPPHLAHEALARSAVLQYALDELIVLPTGHAWHKSRELTAAIHRVEMTRLAFSDVPQVRVDARETLRTGATYTLDTLKEIQAENPQAELFLLMGQDQFVFFPKWHRHRDILQIATLLVALRADSMPPNSIKDAINQDKIAHSTILMNASPISATQIRQLRAGFQAIDHLVKPSVARYIAENRLYLPT